MLIDIFLNVWYNKRKRLLYIKMSSHNYIINHK